LFPWQLWQFVQPIPIFLAYLVPLDVDVTGSISAKICEIWSEFNIFCTLVTMATAELCRNIHRSVWHLLGVEQIQNGGHCHGNQGAKNVKFTPNFTNFCRNVSCHIHL
jgi:hypothetical protein